MGEMPLVIFTIFTQVALGSVATLWLLEVGNKKISRETGRLISNWLVGMLVLGALISTLHLGQPFYAFKAFAHLGSSWLSREVALVTLFIIALVIYRHQWNQEQAEKRRVIGGITVLLAVLTVWSSGMIYVLPAVPAWNNLAPVVFFFLTAALLGPLFVAGVAKLKGEDDYHLPVISGIVAGIYLLSFAIYLSVLLSGSAPQQATGLNLVNNSAFWLRAGLSWLIPFLVLLNAFWRNKQQSTSYLLTVLVLAFTGEIIGRVLFYSTAVALQIAGF